MNSKKNNAQDDQRYNETHLESSYSCKLHRSIVNQAVEELHGNRPRAVIWRESFRGRI
jgi:hypothetical protein